MNKQQTATSDPPDRLRSSPLLRNVLAVVGGSALGQAVVFAFSPLITRIYSSEAFGLQGVFLSLVSTLTPLVALRFPLAIVVAGDETEARQLSRLALSVALGLCALLGIALLAFREPLSGAFGVEALGRLVWFLPLALFCVALQEVMDYRSARLKIFRTVAVVTVIQAFLTNLARVLGGLIAPVAMTLMAVTSVAPGVQAFLLARSGGRRYGPAPAPALGWRQCRRLMATYRDFPLYRTPTDMINAAAQSVPVILLAALFSPSTAGLYVLARSVLNLPTNVVGTAVGNVLYARFAELAREKKALTPLAVKSTLALFAPAPIIIGACQFASPVFAFIFGESWRVSGDFAQWIGLWIAFLVANIAAVRALPVIGAQYLHLIFNLAILAGGIAGLLAGRSLFGTALGSIAIYCVVMAGLYAAQIATYLYFIRNFDRSFLHHGAA